MTAVLVLAAFAATYVLIATERIHRVAAALSGAAAMVLLGVVDARVAVFSEKTGVDWNVIFLLLGMMVIVSVLKQTGVFDYLAIWPPNGPAAGRSPRWSCSWSSRPWHRPSWTT
jgi:Na+/H+ antiporter NhaD/arsenite permease-like protein